VAVDHDQHKQALRTLDENRFVVIRGPVGVGKSGGALNLLGLDEQKVFSLGPAMTAKSLLEFSAGNAVEDGGRYLVEALAPVAASQLTSFVARALTNVLETHAAYMVFTIDEATSVHSDFSRYTIQWTSKPDCVAVLRRHILF
jgi:acetylglutamate kinase